MIPLLVFSALSALVDVFAGDRLQHASPGAVAAVAFSLVGVACCGLALVRRRPAGLLALVREHGRDIAVLNVATAVTWLSLLYALKLMEPAIANVVSIAIGPAFTVVLQALWWRRVAVLRSEALVSAGILAVLVALVWFSVIGHSSVGRVSLPAMSTGVSAAVLSGAGAAATVVFSARLAGAGVDVGTVMGVRFGVVAVCGWVMAAFAGTARLPTAVVPGVVIAVIGVGVPAWLVQLGVRRVSPATASLIVSLAPAMTLLLQLADARLAFSAYSAAGIAVITVLIGIGLLARRGRPAGDGVPSHLSEESAHALSDR